MVVGPAGMGADPSPKPWRPSSVPSAARAYLDRMEALCETPISYVSVGTRRDQIIGVHASL